MLEGLIERVERQRVLIFTGVMALLCVAIFRAGHEAFAALIMSVLAIHLADEIDALRARLSS